MLYHLFVSLNGPNLYDLTYVQALAQTRILVGHQLQATAATQRQALDKAHVRVRLRLLLTHPLPHL